MTRIIIKRTSKMPFTFESGISIIESTLKKTIIHGTLLSEGISRNKNIYTVEEMKNISNQAIGTPIYYGVDPKTHHHKDFDPKTHIHFGTQIGKIIRTVYEESAKKILFWAEITDRKIAGMVKKGWNVSIGGVAKKVQYVLSTTGKIFMKLKDVILHHVQLFEPEYKSGVPDAQVETVVEESMFFDKEFTKEQLAGIITVLHHKGVI